MTCVVEYRYRTRGSPYCAVALSPTLRPAATIVQIDMRCTADAGGRERAGKAPTGEAGGHRGHGELGKREWRQVHTRWKSTSATASAGRSSSSCRMNALHNRVHVRRVRSYAHTRACAHDCELTGQTLHAGVRVEVHIAYVARAAVLVDGHYTQV